MKPWAPLSVLLSSFCLAIFWLCSTGALWRSGNQEWRKLIMVQHWPITVCKEVGNNCTSPPDYWTIHGLWQAFKTSKTDLESEEAS